MPKAKVYHWTLAVRTQHWLHVGAIIVLVATGFYIHNPYMAGKSEMMAWMRWFHLVAAYILIFGFLARFYLMFNSREAADWKELCPLPQNLKNIPDIAAYYLFMKDTHKHYHRYNPLQALAYVMMGLMVVLMFITGAALRAGWLHSTFAWVNPMLGGVMITRIAHFLGMWVLILLTLVHVYFVLRQNALDRDRTLMSMVDGYCVRDAGATD
jgi:Ni/Fe-hydrogenase 1 B-type cytochrome subunit